MGTSLWLILGTGSTNLLHRWFIKSTYIIKCTWFLLISSNDRVTQKDKPPSVICNKPSDSIYGGLVSATNFTALLQANNSLLWSYRLKSHKNAALSCVLIMYGYSYVARSCA